MWLLCWCLSVVVGQVPYPSITQHPGHDPSAAQRTKDGFIVSLVTASGAGEAFGMKYLDPADYKAGWKQGEMSYLTPKWLKEQGWGSCTSCGNKCACPFWAPDLPSNGVLQSIARTGFGGDRASDTFVMYYSAEELQLKSGMACIGRATGTFNPPSSSQSYNATASITWADSGAPIVCSSKVDLQKNGPHAIDPSVGSPKRGFLNKKMTFLRITYLCFRKRQWRQALVDIWLLFQRRAHLSRT
jgi:hypothetical protein